MRRKLQHWTESNIILVSRERSVWRNQKTRSRTVSLRGRQIPIPYLIHEYFRVTGADDSVENYADLFTKSSEWWYSRILLSMTTIPPDDISEGLYKSRIRESVKLSTVLELYDLETEVRTYYHRLKTMLKRSIELVIVRRMPWSRIREQNSAYKEFMEIVGNGSPTDSVLEETIAVSVTMSIYVRKWHCRILPRGTMRDALFYGGEWEKCVENPMSQRQELQW